MKLNIKVTQFLLASLGLFLILLTYFFIPQKTATKIKEQEQLFNKSASDVEFESRDANLFDKIEYKGIFNINNFFTVQSKKAHILKEKPDEVYMTEMLVILNLTSGKTVHITSDKGIYNKLNCNCYFENNVKVTDGETIILSNNLDLFSDNNYASVYNNVILVDARGSLKADKINYNFETEVYKISMYKEDPIEIKVIE